VAHRSLFLSPEDEGGGGNTQAGPTITVRHGDQDITVPKPDGVFLKSEVDAKYVPKAAHNDQMARMRTQLDERKNFRNPEELLGDEQFKTVAIEKWGLNPSATAQQLADNVRRAKEEVLEREVKPLKAQYEKTTTTLARLRDRDLNAQILGAAAKAGVKQALLKAPTKGGTAPIVSMLRGSFGHDSERDDWFARSGDGWAYSQAGGDVPYQTVEEFVAGWVETDGKEFAEPRRQRGPNTETDGRPDGQVSGQVGKELRLTEAQVRDIGYFRKMQAKADREGLTIVTI